jgi:diguanylate cyclase (GGDEF)-like protein/PAS domain S-box-containing protein
MRKLIGRLSFRALIYVAVVFVALAAAAIGFTVWQLRDDAIEDAAKDTGNVASVLSEQVDSSVQSVDGAMKDLQRRIDEVNADSEDDFRSQLSNLYVQLILKRKLDTLPQADAMAIVDSAGRLLNSTDNLPKGTDLSDREYYSYYKNFGNEPIYISKPTRNRVTGAWTIFFSKRIDGPKGEFYGVIVIGVQTSYFRHVYNSISTLADRSFLLARPDGVVLIRHPETDRIDETIPRSSPWHGETIRGGGYYFDDVKPLGLSLVSVRPLKSFPLVVSVGTTTESAFALWRQRAGIIAVGSIFALMCLGVLFRALSSQFVKLHKSEAMLSIQKNELAEKSRALELANVQIDAALNNLSQGLSMFDADGRVILCNDLYKRMFGLSDAEMRPGTTFLELMHHRKMHGGGLRAEPEAVFRHVLKALKAGRDLHGTMHLDDGRIISVVNSPMPGGGWVATHEDVTQRKRAEAQIEHMAHHDVLTGLPNRLLLTERLDGALAELGAEGHPFSVFIFDLDRFKAVNDSLGHPVGDALLKAVAERLRTCAAEETDTVARLGGDEFAILQCCRDVDQREAGIALASRLLSCLSAPYQLDGQDVSVGVSVGIAMAPRDGVTASELLKHADLALYRVKSEGRDGFQFFEREMDLALQSRSALQIDLRKALINGEFELFYQPIMEIGSGSVRGYEALLRWRHPQRGLVPPDRFIPLAEETGLIVSIGEWVLRKACGDAARWPSHLKLAVNLSSVQLNKGRLIDVVSNTLLTSGLAAERLELEVTETALLQDHQDVISVMHQLRSIGVQLVLDDFGTGFSSLSNLQKFPFDKIKIDRSFVDGMLNRSESAAIVSCVVGLGKALNIVITAEGVETEEQLTLLRAAGCDEAQGYLLGRPAPLAALFMPDGVASQVA